MPALDVVFRAAETLGEPAVVKRQQVFGDRRRRGPWRRLRRRDSQLGGRRGTLTDQTKLGMNQEFVVGADALEIGPKPLLDLNIGAVELGLHELTEIGFDQRDAMLKRALQLRNAAQKLRLVRGEVAFPLRAPCGPVGAHVPEISR